MSVKSRQLQLYLPFFLSFFLHVASSKTSSKSASIDTRKILFALPIVRLIEPKVSIQFSILQNRTITDHRRSHQQRKMRSNEPRNYANAVGSHQCWKVRRTDAMTMRRGRERKEHGPPRPDCG